MRTRLTLFAGTQFIGKPVLANIELVDVLDGISLQKQSSLIAGGIVKAEVCLVLKLE